MISAQQLKLLWHMCFVTTRRNKCSFFFTANVDSLRSSDIARNLLPDIAFESYGLFPRRRRWLRRGGQPKKHSNDASFAPNIESSESCQQVALVFRQWGVARLSS